jgi:hypothetical protein
LGPLKISLEMAHYVVCPQKKIISRIFKISGALIVIRRLVHDPAYSLKQGCGSESGLDPDSIGSVDPDPDSGSGSMRAKMTHKSRKLEGGLYYMGGTYIFFSHPKWSKLCTAPLKGLKNPPPP